MKLKMKLITAAVALAASAGANAAMNNFASGNGTLAFIALDNIGTPISAMMDLNYNIDDFTPTAMSTAGTHIVWDFNANSLTVNGVAQAVSPTWSHAMSTFAASAQTAETQWAVIAGDSLGNGTLGDIRYLTTSNTALTTLQTQTKVNLQGFSLSDALFNGNNLLQPNPIDGSTASSGQAFAGDPANFGANGNWQNKFVGNSFAIPGICGEILPGRRIR